MASIHYYHYHHESGHDYIKHNTANESGSPYLGIELEVDKGGCSDRAATAFDEKFTVHNDPEWLMFENDGSLNNGFEIISSEFERIPNDLKDVTPEQRESVNKLLEKIEEDEDVQNVFHNMREEDEEE